jgi:hypothetical protein
MPPKKKTATEAAPATQKAARRKPLMQSDVPSYSIVEALRVPQALRDEYGKQATRPLMVAKAMSMTPTGGTFKMITGAAVAYELTDGAAQGESIGLTDLGRRAVAPTAEGDDQRAIREAILKPRVVREFLERYDGAKVPSRGIALNVVEEMGVPTDSCERAFDMILENARIGGFLQQINEQNYINLQNFTTDAATPPSDATDTTTPADETTEVSAGTSSPVEHRPTTTGAATERSVNDIATNKRVFITHGRNRGIVDQLKEVLTFGQFDPIVSVDNEAVAKPLPDKVMDDMRSCGAGIVHVGTEKTLMDGDGKEHRILNSNVLIEIGAALALSQLHSARGEGRRTTFQPPGAVPGPI